MKTAYSTETLKWLRKNSMKVEGAVRARHFYPRAYCVAKPSPLCAVFITPWIDSEPQVRSPEYSASHVVHEGVADVQMGDWCALAYVVQRCGTQQLHAFKLPTGDRNAKR